jgi:alpha-L-rhamnosidase
MEAVDERGRVASQGAQVSASDAVVSRDWSPGYLTDGDLVSHGTTGTEALPTLRVRGEFRVERPVRRATLFATALGVYEPWLNGRHVGNQELAPEWTDYPTRVQVQAYDVTDLVREGENCLAAHLGDGWYAGRLGMAQMLDELGRPRGVYGRRPEFLAQLEIEHADGTRTTVATGPDWQVSEDGPVRTSDLLDGEVVDATREEPGWAEAGFVSGRWGSARTRRLDGRALVPMSVQPIRTVTALPTRAVTMPAPGVWVLDFGQNAAGRARFRFDGPAGTRVQVRYGEMLDEAGRLYTANLRGAPQTDTFVLDGGGGWLSTKFTMHGFRFAEVTGLPGPMLAEDAEALPFCTSAPVVAEFECSDPMVNRLWQNVLWTQRSNLTGVPTDCPQRDERLGWTGDILVFGRTACLNMDMGAFLDKWLLDLRDSQATDGRFPDVAPHPYGKDRHFTGAPGWGDAGVFTAWDHYLATGDVLALQLHRSAMEKWVAFVEERNPDGIWRQARGNDYGDWLNGDTLVREGWPRTGGEVPKEVFATMMAFKSADILADALEALGSPAAAARERAETVRKAFLANYLAPDKRLPGDTQAGYAIAIDFGLADSPATEQAWFDHLVAALERTGGRLTTGFHSTHRMMNVLTRHGRSDLAYALLTSREFPSWGYGIDQGATTVWERWDGFVAGRGFQDPGMNSFNHWAFGAVSEWIAGTVAGVTPVEPGWSKVRVAPIPGGGLTWAKFRHTCVKGRIAVDWRLDGGEMSLDVTVPANVEATIVVPGGDTKTVVGGRHRFKTRP